MTHQQNYDLYSQTFKANAYQTYALMRQNTPVLYQPGLDGVTMHWFVTRFEDVEAVLRDDKRFVRDPRNAFPAEQVAEWPDPTPVFELIDNHVLNKDGEDHRRLRALVSKAFTSRIVGQMRDRIQNIADDLIDQVQAQGQMDLINDYAFPLPITVIAELLGIPAADRDKFRLWSDAVVTPDLSQGAHERFVMLMNEFTTYLGQIFTERRQQPGDDLITALLQAEEAGDKLSEAELFSMMVLLIVAGHETTVNLISNGILALLQHPDQLEKLKKDPSLMPVAVEELLRYDGPVEQALIRWAAEDVELGGQLIRRGDQVVVILAAADRDPAQFPEPDSLDLAREPNRHVAFGRGVHYCLGAPLARLEGEIALNTLLRRLPNLRLNIEPGQLTWRLAPLIRGVVSLPVAWD